MTRAAAIIVFLGASALAGCDVTFYEPDYSRPVIESVEINPANPAVGEVITVSARVWEPDSWYQLSYDTNGDGRFDDQATVTYYTAGARSIRVRAQSAGGEDVVTYPIYVSDSSLQESALTIRNDTGHGVGLTISESDGDTVVFEEYVAPNDEYVFYGIAGAQYKLSAGNQYAAYGPDWLYLGTSPQTISVSSLDY